MGDTELEEGEACDDPDSACDPDTAFSYLDEKLVLVLGDVQKAFEGGVSAEKLGSKYGGYGSFLPAYERTPSNFFQDKPVSVLTNDFRAKKSPSDGNGERIKWAATGSSGGVSNQKASSGPGPLLSDDGGRSFGPTSRKSLADDSVALLKAEDNSGLQKKVTLRIKMGSDTSARKNNTSIYSDFGLCHSSSASLEDEDDDDEDDDDKRSVSDMDLSPDKTPLTMIQIMTSHNIPDGFLLSPLPDLLPEPFLHKEKVKSATQKKPTVSNKPSLVYEAELMNYEDNDKMERMKESFRENYSDWKGESNSGFEHGRKLKKEEKVQNGKTVSKATSKALGKETSKLIDNSLERLEKDAVSESGAGMRGFDIGRGGTKGSTLDKGSLDCPLEEAENAPKEFESPFEPLRDFESIRESASKASSKLGKSIPLLHEQNAREQSDFRSSQTKESGKELSTPDLGVHGKKHLDMNWDVSEGKKRIGTKDNDLVIEEKTNVNKDAVQLGSKFTGVGRVLPHDIVASDREGGKEASETKKKSKEASRELHTSKSSSKEKGKQSLKEGRRSSAKETNMKEALPRDQQNDMFKEGNKEPSKTSVKDSQRDLLKAQRKESGEPRKKEKSKERIKTDFTSKDTAKITEKERQKDLSLARDVPLKLTSTGVAHNSTHHSEANVCDQPSSVGGLLNPLTTANGVAAAATAAFAPVPASNYTVITQNWVACDKCEKWRLLPPGVETDQLPKKWRCKMLYWIPNVNNCSVSEEETTQATEALYNLLAAQPQPPVTVQANNPVAEPARQAPSAAAPGLPSSSNLGNSSQEAGIVDKTKISHSKKRKPSENSSVRSRSTNDASRMTHEGTRGRIDSEDACHTQTGEERRKVKEREKTKRARPIDGASPFGKDHVQSMGILRDAINLKHHADRLKGKEGMERESTDLYLRAALSFLQAAALQEAEGAEAGENTHPLSLYTDTAKLCEFCAHTYERSKGFAAAVLAYKCAGSARMRVVQAKSSIVSRDRAELLSAQQQAPPGESPSSSIASDVDNLNHLSADRLPVRGTTSPSLNTQSGGNIIIPARCRTSYNRLLQYGHDTASAVEALSKSHNAYTAAESTSSSAGTEGMLAVKRVLDFSYHDVESLVRLVRLAMEAIGH